VQSVRCDNLTSTSATCAFATAPGNGHLLLGTILAQFSVLSPPTLTAGTGWTQIGQSAALISTTANSATTYQKFAGASEPTSQTPATFSVTNTNSVIMYEIANANATTPVEFIVTTGTGGTGSGSFTGTPAVYTSPSHTPTVLNELMLFIGYAQGSAPTSAATATGYASDFFSITRAYAAVHATAVTSNTSTPQNIVITYPGSTSTSADFEGTYVFVRP
jgi:hypothetical protein